jgi:hypothetical protein
VQHIHIKLFAESPASAAAEEAIPVFHRWIQTGAEPGLLIDVADYSHVPAGPGVLLIAHEFNLGLDLSGNRLGLLYCRKTALGGGPDENLQAVYEALSSAARRLESEPEFRGRLRFRRDELQVILNDRLLYPNNAQTWSRLSEVFERFFGRVFGGAERHYRLSADPRQLFSVTATARPPG